MIESMAMEIPVIASDTGGNAELVADGETGYVVPPGDARALAHAIQKMATDSDRTTEMGKQSRMRIAEYFNHEQAVVGYKKFFEGLIS